MSNESTGDETKNRKIGRSIAVVVASIVVVALIIGGTRNKADAPSKVSDAPEGCKSGYLFSETTGKPCPQDKASMTDTTTTSVSVAPSAYEDAIHSYAGKVIVFDAACTPVATTASVAAGTRVLVANNSDKQLTLALGAKSEVLDGYHYFTTTLTTKGDAKVTCNGKDAVTISVK